MEPVVRLRLLFEDESILTDGQKFDGFDRCWLLLPSDAATVSDLASHLISSFSLQCSCPHGLLLSMYDFVLPPFESTCVFKDKDIVRIWKKDIARRHAIMPCDNTILVEDVGAAETQPNILCDKPLTIRNSGTESIEDSSDMEEDAAEESKEPNLDHPKNSLRKIPSRKRKHINHKKQKKLCRLANQFHIARCPRKRAKLKKVESETVPLVNGLESVPVQRKQHALNANKEKGLCPSDNSPAAHHGLDIAITSSTNKMLGDVSQSNINVNRGECSKEKSHDDQGEIHKNDTLKKFPSRSARRKKAKRRFQRELPISEKNKFSEFPLVCLPEITSPETRVRKQEPIVDFVKKEVASVVVKPGHIRFEQSDEDEQPVQRTGVQQTILWNGTLDKKKGQKWGRERTFTGEKTERVAMDKDYGESDELEFNEVSVNSVDFEKLCPLVGLPKVGDVIAYRVVELTSSWCPEISTFRVGKVSSIDPVTMNSIIVPVPGYPIPTQVSYEDFEMESGHSLYKEDSSLEIEFSSLVDVRLLKDDNYATMVTPSGMELKDGEAPISNLNTASSLGTNVNHSIAIHSSTAKEITGWDEVSEALNRKKAELMQRNIASSEKEATLVKDSTTKPSWFYRALRGSALGPTISLLRANNQL